MADLIKEYKDFLDNGKTERRCVNAILKRISAQGYKDIFETDSLKAGDKVFYQKMGKSIILFEIGRDDIEKGMNILGAHIDSPRLDAKQKPVYEKDGLVYLNTHYYGGIKKYQWVTLPLALNGYVFTKDGRTIDVNIGDASDDPVFCISDILIHCAQDQMKKPASEVIDGEKLDVIIGSGFNQGKGNDCCSGNDSDGDQGMETKKEKDEIKKNVLSILKRKYDFEEEDLLSAEIEVVPAGRARFCGFDKNLILAYGQDDRSCAFASLEAMLASKAEERTNCCILTDKEEIGSYGATGMDSHLLDNAVS